MALTNKKAWKNLRKHAVKTGNLHMSELFADDDRRFKAFSSRNGNLLLDYSKQRVTPKTIELLCNLARECNLNAWIEKLFSGDTINTSENRAALHTALRLPSGSELSLNGNNIVVDIHETLDTHGTDRQPHPCRTMARLLRSANHHHSQYRGRRLRSRALHGEQGAC